MRVTVNLGPTAVFLYFFAEHLFKRPEGYSFRFDHETRWRDFNRNTGRTLCRGMEQPNQCGVIEAGCSTNE